jgi:aldose 1-epimerase
MLTLASGDNSVVVAPEHGAGLIGWLRGRTPMLRRALPSAACGGDRHAMACFPMLPYCNRAAHARFPWHGETYRLAHNFGDNPHSIHGIGWQRAWSVARAAPDSAVLELEHRPDGSWPFAFRAVVAYSLAADALTVSIALTNRETQPAPAGIGLHPFFPRAHGPALRFDATGVWENTPDCLPDRHVPVPAEWSHAAPLPVSEVRLDHCFTGWSGSADISAGPASLRIEASEAFGQLQVFTPHWADFFCVEPVSHIPDAMNRPGLPRRQAMDALEPGQSLSGTVRLSAAAG